MSLDTTATKIVFIESDEVSFQFRQCMAGVIQSLPEVELLLARNADEALNLIEQDRADVLVVDDELTDDLQVIICLLYTSPSPRDATLSRMPSSA